LGLGEELLRMIDDNQARLDLYWEIEQRDFSAPSLSRAQQVQYAILKAGIRKQQMWLEWSESVRPLLGV
jgi:hypothetical protein